MRPTFVFLLTLAFSSAAVAQSFDCKLAQTPREHAVCSDRNLAALDAGISAALKSLHDQLSPESAALVDSDQREWLQWIDLVCPEHAKGPLADQTRCFYNQYSARARDLKKTAHIGTAIIFPRAHFLYQSGSQSSKLPSPDYPGFGYGSLRWPQIDIKPRALTPAEAAWNQAIKERAAKLGAGVFDAGQSLTFDTAVNALEDIDTDYSVDAANDRLVEVSLIVRSYLWVSGAHPLTIRSSFLWWLDRNRELTTEDVFLPVSAWQAFLASVATGRLQANSRLKPVLRDEATLNGAAQQSAPQASNWTLTQNGLTIIFLQGMVAANVAGMPRVFISWEDLKPFLEPALNPATLPARLPNPVR
jgi:uncharacterized protein YecT (DUF1311 family)